MLQPIYPSGCLFPVRAFVSGFIILLFFYGIGCSGNYVITFQRLVAFVVHDAPEISLERLLQSLDGPINLLRWVRKQELYHLYKDVG